MAYKSLGTPVDLGDGVYDTWHRPAPVYEDTSANTRPPASPRASKPKVQFSPNVSVVDVDQSASPDKVCSPASPRPASGNDGAMPPPVPSSPRPGRSLTSSACTSASESRSASTSPAPRSASTSPAPRSASTSPVRLRDLPSDALGGLRPGVAHMSVCPPSPSLRSATAPRLNRGVMPAAGSGSSTTLRPPAPARTDTIHADFTRTTAPTSPTAAHRTAFPAGSSPNLRASPQPSRRAPTERSVLDHSTLHRFPWFHGDVSREVAESRLTAGGGADGLFLVRGTSAGPNVLAISMCHARKVSHYTVEAQGDGSVVHSTLGVYKPTLEQLIGHLLTIANRPAIRITNFVPRP